MMVWRAVFIYWDTAERDISCQGSVSVERRNLYGAVFPFHMISASSSP